MAIDKLVDSGKLDACCEAEAAAIIAKGGGTAPLAYDFANNKGFADAIAAIPSGGGIESGVEVVELDSAGKPVILKLYGDIIPNSSLKYAFYDSGVRPLLSFNEPIRKIGKSAIQRTYVNFDDAFFNEVTEIGEFALTCFQNKDTELTIPKWDGRYEMSSGESVFRCNDYAWTTFNLPRVQYIGNFWWYQVNKNLTVQLGSVGYPVLQCSQRPFGSTTGTSTVTVYTRGDLLDTISTAIKSQAGANYTFIFKASEATTYGNTSYAAGETMLTISP